MGKLLSQPDGQECLPLGRVLPDCATMEGKFNYYISIANPLPLPPSTKIACSFLD